MQTKLFVLMLLIVIAGLLNGGCGSSSTSVLYDTPNWMPDGRIVCSKLVITTSQQLYGGGVSESKGYIAAFWPSGTDEVNLYEEGNVSEITCSPTGELIAYIHASYGGVRGGIMVSDYFGNKQLVQNTSDIKYLDWSPDANKLVFSDSSRNLYVINRDGTEKTKIAASAEAVAWRVGEKIVYEFVENGYVYLGRTNTDGSSKESFGSMSVYSPQISTTNSNYVYGTASSAYRKLNVSNVPLTEDILITSFTMYKPRLSFDNTKIVSGAWGDPGIWLINIDGTGYTKIR